MSKKDEALEMAQELRALADRFSEGWHEGIKIDALDIELLAMAASAIEQPAQPYKGIADHINHATNGRVKIDPVTGNVSIGAQFPPAQQQEPVAYCNDTAIERLRDEPGDWMLIYGKPQHPHKVPLYAAPPASKPLTYWQPIETAPKDGTKILGWNEEFGARETKMNFYGEGSIGFAAWKSGKGPKESGWDWSEPKNNWGFTWRPSHWMPLPADPIKAAHGQSFDTHGRIPPASKPWVGLTPEQRATIAEANNMLVDDDLFDAIEAKLREKNA